MEFENKILKTKIKLYEEIRSDENMILYHTSNRAKTIANDLDELYNVEISCQRKKEIIDNTYGFLMELSQSKFENMHEFAKGYVSSRKIRIDILSELNK